MSVNENYHKIKQEVTEAARNAGRNPSDITTVAVTKYVSVETAKAAIDAGVTDLGENRDKGFLEKFETIGDRATWHFIGTLQSKKVKHIIDHVDFIHSLDRLSLAKEIQKRATDEVKCFIQVNGSGEESKHGLEPEDVIPFIKDLEAYPKIKVVGLMTMAANTDDDDTVRETFRTLKQLQEKVKALDLDHAPCQELSMGMSNDFKIAVEEGATYIRLGTSLVGKEY